MHNLLCFFSDCPDELFNNMKMYCAKYIRVCKEINMSFIPQEAQVSVVRGFIYYLLFYLLRNSIVPLVLGSQKVDCGPYPDLDMIYFRTVLEK